MGGPLHVLLVTNSDEQEELVVGTLGLAGYDLRCRRVQDPDAYSKALASEQCMVVICDAVGPEFTVIDARRLLTESRLDIPFILLSSASSEGAAMAAVAAGVHDYIVRDDLARLVPAIERELAEAAVRRARRRTESALREREAYLRAVLQNVADGIVTFDEAGTIESFNPAAERIFRCTADRVMGRNIRELAPELSAEATSSAVREQEGQRPDGERFPMEVAVGEMRVGQRRLFIATLRDVTERKRLERQLQLAQRMESVAMLAGGIAHDFNNILTGIITYSVLAKSMVGPEDPVQEELTEIEQQGQRAAVLVKQLQAFSRNQRLETRNIQLGEVISSVQKFLRRVIGENIALSVSTDPHLGTVSADASQLEQVLMNLCVNARDAMPRGGTLTIEATNVRLDEAFCRHHLGARAGAWVRLSVSDTGEGMSPETLHSAFEPFFTTKETGKGTGLGLAVVYGIVKQHGGFIDVESQLGRGTTVSIYLSPMQVEPARPQARRRTRAPGGKETILLAEDEQGVRRAAIRILESYGYTVLPAADGEEALRLFRQHRERIHMVILDAVMPRGDGKEVYESMHAERPDLKFLFVTGYSSSVFSRNFKRVRRGGANFLQKPFNPEELARRVRTVLDAKPRD